MSDELKDAVARNILVVASHRRLSLNKVADFAVVNPSAFYRALGGREAMSVDWLAKIAEALSIPCWVLLLDDEEDVVAYLLAGSRLRNGDAQASLAWLIQQAEREFEQHQAAKLRFHHADPETPSNKRPQVQTEAFKHLVYQVVLVSALRGACVHQL